MALTTSFKEAATGLALICAFVALWVHLDHKQAKERHDRDLVFGIAVYCSGAPSAFDFKYPVPDGRGLWATQGCNGMGAWQRPRDQWQKYGRVGYYCKLKNVEDCRPKGFHDSADDTDYRTQLGGDN